MGALTLPSKLSTLAKLAYAAAERHFRKKEKLSIQFRPSERRRNNLQAEEPFFCVEVVNESEFPVAIQSTWFVLKDPPEKAPIRMDVLETKKPYPITLQQKESYKWFCRFAFVSPERITAASIQTASRTFTKEFDGKVH